MNGSPPAAVAKSGWKRQGGSPRRLLDDGCSNMSNTVLRAIFQILVAALMATLVTFAVSTFFIEVNLETGQGRQLQAVPPLPGISDSNYAVQPAPRRHRSPPPGPPPAAPLHHPFKDTHHGMYRLEVPDPSDRCRLSKICDGQYECGPDKLGCVTDSKQRQHHVRDAIRWSWLGYKKYAWGFDEADVLSKKPHAWFDLGLTIVDSIDTLLLAGLSEEYAEARHWVANHLHFPDGATVQFFEVNIRIMGGLLSSYYLSGGDELFLHKARQLGDRLSKAFSTSSGMPVTMVQFSKGGAAMRGDSVTNLAEAGTMSMEFTTAGRLLGRDDLSEMGMLFWYDLVGMRNFTGLYCLGFSTSKGECVDSRLSIGSAADSAYEYMLKQWILSNKTQELPLQLYKAAMEGMRKYLVRDVFDGRYDMSYVSETNVDLGSGQVAPANDRFEHLTCFVGGMLILGGLHNVSTQGDDDLDDIELGARIGRACYEMYHQTPTGVAMDSVYWRSKTGSGLPHGPRWPGDQTWRPRQHGRRKVGAPSILPATNATSTTGLATSAPGAPNSSNSSNSNTAPAARTSSSSAHAPQGTGMPHSQQQQQPTTAAPLQRQGRRLMQSMDTQEEQQQVAQPGQQQDGQQPDEQQQEDKLPDEQQPEQQQEQQQPEQQQGAAPVAALGQSTTGPVTAATGATTAATGAGGAAAVGSGASVLQDMQALQQQPGTQQQVQQPSGQLQYPIGRQQTLRRQQVQEAAAQQQQQQVPQPRAQQQQPRTGGDISAVAPGTNTATPLAQGGTGVQPTAAASPPPPPAVPEVGFMAAASREDFLRPEAAETLFYLWRATGDQVYREWGWSMFRAWEKWSKQKQGGYGTIRDVYQVPAAVNDKMESFWVAETLKYLYLLFEDDGNVVPLDKWVFNTEAHPLPIWGTEPDLQALKRLKQRAAQEAAAAKLQAEEEAAGLGSSGYYQRLSRKIIASGGDQQGYGFGKVEGAVV